jgi:hypothetical protein
MAAIRSITIAGSVAVAVGLGVAILLISRPLARDALPAPTAMPPAALQMVRSRMEHHDAQMKALVSRVALLDDDGVARVAGEIFDEPLIARPRPGDELAGAIPERFLALQDELRAQARRLVAASGTHDRDAIADEFAGVARGCVSCHQVFVHGDGTRVGQNGTRP